MKEYQQNKKIIGLIVIVMVIGSIIIGTIVFAGSSTYGWMQPSEKVYYEFEESSTNSMELVLLDLSINVGSININFEDNSTLLYRIELETDKNVVNRNGLPVVKFLENSITLDYSVAKTNVTLGSGTIYDMKVETSTGLIELITDGTSHLGEKVDLETKTGAIGLYLNDDIVIHQNTNVELNTSTGSIDAIIDLPEEVGGVFAASTSIGSVDINAPLWKSVGSSYYETLNYRSADFIVTISAETGVGSIEAILQ